MSTIDQQFVEFVVKSLVGHPDDVVVARRIDEKGVLLELTVNPEDLGRVIGKRGATAQSLRTLLRALGTKNEARYNLKIIDNGERPPASAGAAETEEKTEPTETEKPVPPASEPPAAKDNLVEDMADEETEKLLSAEPETDHSSVVSKTRKELEELDDLDV